MNIIQIAKRLNQKASQEKYQIAVLPELRKKYLGKRKLPDQIFTNHTIFNNDDIYAFHHGGRDEMQFNIGEEYVGKKTFTRFALCFSLEASRSLPNPAKDLEPFKKRYNQCVEVHPELLAGFKMWYYRGSERNGNFAPRKIPDQWFKNGTFIAIGNLIDKPLDNLTEIDLTEILEGFDRLFPIYKFCVLKINSALDNEKRMARLCWNTNQWQSPIVHEWRIENQNEKSNNSFEQKYGFGHEEWLFNPLFKWKGSQFGYIQGLSGLNDSNHLKELHLFTIDSVSKNRFYVGFIKDVEILSDDIIEKEGIADLFKPLLSNMIEELVDTNAYFKKLKESGFIPNIRFSPEKVTLFDPMLHIQSNLFINSYFRYQPFYYSTKIQREIFGSLPNNVNHDDERRDFKFKPGKSNKSLTLRVSTRQKKVVQSKPLHDKIQQILYNHLVLIYGKHNVGMETNTGLATRIDISVNDAGGIILYEVKSYPSVMITIRAALGQLLEYAYYPNPIQNLKEMVIVSHIPIKAVDKEYLEFIRKITSLQIFYQSLDPDTKILSGKV